MCATYTGKKAVRQKKKKKEKKLKEKTALLK